MTWGIHPDSPPPGMHQVSTIGVPWHASPPELCVYLHQSCLCISTRAGTSLWWSEKAFAWSKLSAVHCPAPWLIQIIVGLNEFQGHLSGDSGASKANIDWSDTLWLRRVRNKVLKSKLCTVILLWSCVTTRICDATTEFATDGVCNCHLVTA